MTARAAFATPARVHTARRFATRVCIALVLVLCVMMLPAARANAQTGWFGTNKIQYRNFDWRVLKGPHVDLYYYPAEERIARMALAYAEESYGALEQRFHHSVRFRIPLIIYASHSDFEQTNILPFVPPEGILGVTEFLKQRVTVPFRGSYAEFRHTLRHELVHVFQLSLAQRRFHLYPRGRSGATPLWWSEGLAEYWSSEQDSRDEMIVRDLTVTGQMPSIRQLGLTWSPIVYPLGGELHRFLARKYGDWRVTNLYDVLWKYDSFDEALVATYGRTLERLTDEWHYDLRQRYFPDVQARRPVDVAGTRLEELAVKPVALPRKDGGAEIAYLSPRSGYTDIYLVPLEERRRGRSRVEVKGERTPEFESFHTFSSRMDAREGVLLFSSKFGDRDALFFWDTRKHRVVGRYQFDSLASILSPAFSPDGRRVAFSALSLGGVSDLYIAELPSGSITRVTNDVYEDLDPTWLPGGESLVFASDRGVGGEEGAHNLHRVRIGDGAISAVTHGDWNDETPRWDPELGRIVFSSDRDGTFNLYSVDSVGNGRRESRVDGGIFDPAPVPGDSQTVVMAFHDFSWSLYRLATDTTARRDTFSLAPPDSATTWVWSEPSDVRVRDVAAAPYKRDFSLDFAAGGSNALPGYGTVGGGQVFFSDLLGDHALALSVATFDVQGSGSAGLLDNLNVDAFYLNQQRRLNWGVGAFRTAGNFLEGDLIQVYRERSAGGYGVVRYPFSRFSRVEAQTRLEYSSRDDYFSSIVEGPTRRRGVLSSNFLTFVTDNTLWLDTGPIDGTRVNVTGGVVSDVTHGRFENWTGLLDARRYLRTSLQSAFALRAYGYVSEGVRPRAIQIGGTWLLRGYPLFSFDNPVSGTHAWVANAEWRVPITNFVTVGFPFGAVRFPQVQGAVFNDFGQAWYNREYAPRVLGSAGVGFRTAIIPGLVLRLDVGSRWTPNPGARGIPGTTDSFYRGRFVDFFFGYNY
jgi:WD40-like Beta Propeller Repeat